MIQIEDDDAVIAVAHKIIYGTKKADMTPAKKIGIIIATGKAPEDEEEYEEEMFSLSELRELADYLTTYCKHHEGYDEYEQED